jgi:hypothetical protein
MVHWPFTTSKQSKTGPGLDDAVADADALRLPVAEGEGDAEPARLRVGDVDSVAAALRLDVGSALCETEALALADCVTDPLPD